MTPDERELIDAKKRLEEFADQLRYVFENLASEVYALSECHCDHLAGDTPCAYCASEHFVNWFRLQPEFAAWTGACGDCDPCLGGHPEQCAVSPQRPKP